MHLTEAAIGTDKHCAVNMWTQAPNAWDRMYIRCIVDDVKAIEHLDDSDPMMSRNNHANQCGDI